MSARQFPTSEGRLVNRSMVLTAVTFILLTPPIIAIFDIPIFVFGIPLLHIYCFSIWLAAICFGRPLAMRMAALEGSPDPSGQSARGPADRV